MATLYDGGLEPGEAGIDRVLAEIAAARAARSLALCAAAVDAAEDGVATAADVAPMVRALHHLECLASGPTGRDLDAGRLLDRLATAHLIASPRLASLHTRIPALPATPRGARCVLAAGRELLQVLEGVAVGDADGHVEASLWAVTGSGFLTLAGTVTGEGRPVPAAGGAEAFARLTRLAEACGGAARRRHCGEEGVKVGVALGSWVLAR